MIQKLDKSAAPSSPSRFNGYGSGPSTLKLTPLDIKPKSNLDKDGGHNQCDQIMEKKKPNFSKSIHNRFYSKSSLL